MKSILSLYSPCPAQGKLAEGDLGPRAAAPQGCGETILKGISVFAPGRASSSRILLCFYVHFSRRRIAGSRSCLPLLEQINNTKKVFLYVSCIGVVCN